MDSYQNEPIHYGSLPGPLHSPQCNQFFGFLFLYKRCGETSTILYLYTPNVSQGNYIPFDIDLRHVPSFHGRYEGLVSHESLQPQSREVDHS